ncbi:MAG: aldose epimerase family protein [Verrucomicrobiota bacterium]
MRSLFITTILGMLALTGCQSSPPAGVTSSVFGHLPDGKPVTLYTLKNSSGSYVSIMDYGATVVDLVVPDRLGKPGDVSLGFDTFEPYLTKSPYFGASIGRFGNRIAKGQFALEGKSYQLAINDTPNTLHGGTRGFDKCQWSAAILPGSEAAVRFSRVSPDGEEGYPGTLTVAVTYRFTADNRLEIAYEAATDKTTVLNLTNHTYFNLAGRGPASIKDHQLLIRASHYTPVDDTLIPTGEIKAVSGTPFDFQVATPIGQRLSQAGGKPIGYDHNFVLDARPDGVPLVEVSEPTTGRWMHVFSDQPGVQFYSGNFLDGTLTGKDGQHYQQYTAIVLETQHFPDSPNQPGFPTTVLKPGETYRTKTTYAFGVNTR